MTTIKAKKVQTFGRIDHRRVTVRELDTRSARVFREELGEVLAKGFDVYGLERKHDCVEITLGRKQDQTLDELMAEVSDMLVKVRN